MPETVINGIKIRFLSKAVINEVFFEDPYRIEEIPDGGLVIDIGAHIGTFTLRCTIEKHCTVYAYEPSQLNFDLLATNITLNGVEDRVKIFHEAIGKRYEKRPFYTITNASAGSSFYRKPSPYREEEIVQCTTLKHIFEDNHIGECDVLKLDCEEAEREIFNEEAKPYFSKVDSVMLEWHNYDGHIYANYLRELGFTSVLTGTGKIVKNIPTPVPKINSSFARGMLYAKKTL